MAYDNTKLDLAVSRWLERECTTGGDNSAFARDLMESFVDFCKDTKALKNSPGRVAFGKALTRSGHVKIKTKGYSAWSGIELINPPEVSAICQNSLTGAALARQKARLAQREKEAKANQKKLEKERADDRADHAAHVRDRMRGESKEVAQAAGVICPDQASE